MHHTNTLFLPHHQILYSSDYLLPPNSFFLFLYFYIVIHLCKCVKTFALGNVTSIVRMWFCYIHVATWWRQRQIAQLLCHLCCSLCDDFFWTLLFSGAGVKAPKPFFPGREEMNPIALNGLCLYANVCMLMLTHYISLMHELLLYYNKYYYYYLIFNHTGYAHTITTKLTFSLWLLHGDIEFSVLRFSVEHYSHQHCKLGAESGWASQQSWFVFVLFPLFVKCLLCYGCSMWFSIILLNHATFSLPDVVWIGAYGALKYVYTF